MIKYEILWYNYVAQENQTIYAYAKDKDEAKEIALLEMQYFGGGNYKIDDIESIHEANDNYYITLEEAKKKYTKPNVNEMTFHEAFKLLQEGKAVRRKSWKGYWILENDTLMMHCREGEVIEIFDTVKPMYTLENLAANDFVEAILQPESK